MKRKLLTILALLAVMSLLLAACAASAPQQPAAGEVASPEVLRVWIQWGDNPQQVQELFDQYTAETGVKVEVTAPIDGDKILPALTGSNPPDILVLSGGDAATQLNIDGSAVTLYITPPSGYGATIEYTATIGSDCCSDLTLTISTPTADCPTNLTITPRC